MFNEDDVRGFYLYLGHHPDEWTELRAIEWSPDKRGAITQSWVNNIEDFVKFCKEWNQKRHVYTGINPRRTNGGSKKEDITRVTGIPFDIDAKRDQGHEKDAATDEEIHETYTTTLGRLLEFIKENGYNDPYIDFSGNGFRVIQKVDMPISNHETASSKLEQYFKEVKLQIPELDSIFDLPRIIKVPGTWSIKGENTEQRPHRIARIKNIGSNEPDKKLESHIKSLNIETNTQEQETPITPTSDDETLRKLTQAQRNKDIKTLYDGEWEKYGEGKPKWSRSEAESSLIYRLYFYDLSKQEIYRIMNGCKIGKWQESSEQYRKRTLDKAYEAYLENPQRFFIGTMFVTKRIGDEILKDHKFMATSENSELWMYHKEIGVWKPDGTKELQQIVIKKLKDRWQSHYTNETEKYIRHSNYANIDELGGPPNKIVVKNGILNLETKQLEPFNPDIKAITAIPITYNPDAECPKIHKFVSEVVHPENVKKIFQLIGYCLYKGYPIARIFIFTGTGRNGKSVLINLLISFIGQENISSVDIQNLTDDSFRTPELYGKLANINGDLPAKPIKDTGLIKKATGQDPLTAAKKHKDPFQFYNHAKLIFSANDVPRVNDHSDAMHRRFDVIEFPNKFDENDPKTDPELINKITTEEELSGLLNEALTGLDEILESGKFHNDKDIETRKMDYIKRSDQLHYFAITYLEQDTDPEHYVTKSQLYNHYVFMCRTLDKIPTSDNWFSRSIRRYVPFMDEGWVAKDKVWRGIRVNLEKLQSLTNDTNGISTLVMTDMDDKKLIPPTTMINYSKNTVGTVGDKTERILEILSETPNLNAAEIGEELGVTYEEAKKLLAVTDREGNTFQSRPGFWRLT